MGVRCLTSYLENYCSSACYLVSIEELIEQYKAESSEPPVVVIDAMSVMRPLYDKLSWLNGGQLKEFRETIETFIEKFTSLSCKLVVFNDGPMQDEKLSVWKRRRIDNAHNLCSIFDSIETETPVSQLEETADTMTLPNGIQYIFESVVEDNENCVWMTSLLECDLEIADYADKNNCFAILAQDSDYVILRAAKYYLSIKHLNLDNMTTLCYDGFVLAQSLGLHSQHLPLLASLLGNDILEYNLLRSFHRYLHNHFRAPYGTLESQIVFKVAQFIKTLRHPDDVSQVSIAAFHSMRNTDLLRSSLESYNLAKVNVSEAKKKVLLTRDEEWNQVINHMISETYLHRLFDIILNWRFTSSTCLEDYRPNQMIPPSGKVLANLRKYIYGFLLDEKKPCVVNELVMAGFNDLNYSQVKPHFLKTKHPGLLSIWTDKTDAMRTVKLNMLEEIFQVKSLNLTAFPHRLTIPLLALKYISNEKVKIFDWELDALIATCACVYYYTTDELRQLPNEPLCKRSVLLYTLVSRTYTVVRILLINMTDIFPLNELSLEKFTDGKLFHDMYRKSKNQVSLSTICKHKKSLELFTMMRSFLNT